MTPHMVHDLPTVGILAVTNTADQELKDAIYDGFALIRTTLVALK